MSINNSARQHIHSSVVQQQKFDDKILKIDKMTPKIKTLGSKKTPVDRLKVKRRRENIIFSSKSYCKFVTIIIINQTPLCHFQQSAEK